METRVEMLEERLVEFQGAEEEFSLVHENLKAEVEQAVTKNVAEAVKEGMREALVQL